MIPLKKKKHKSAEDVIEVVKDSRRERALSRLKEDTGTADDDIPRTTVKAIEKYLESKAVKFNASEMQASIGKLLKFSTFEPEQRYWLDTGSPELNGVFGSKEKGIPYGKVLELSGEEHAGKTLVSTLVAAMAQRDGAGVGRVDLEDARDDEWEIRLGLDPSSVVTIYPKLVLTKAAVTDDDNKPVKKDKKKKKGSRTGIPRLQSAEEMFEEMKVGMALLAQKGFKKQFWFLDSIAYLRTDMQLEAGISGQNMRTRNDRAMLLSEVLPELAGLAANYNATVFLLNQLREKPGISFGDPLFSPGGRALRHSCSIRARIRRCKGGQLRKGDRIVGLVGIIKNTKNKAGGGSQQTLECGFKIKWSVDPARVEFMSKEDAEALLKA